jgi:tetratricopeptide (TPR) repeat protein
MLCALLCAAALLLGDAGGARAEDEQEGRRQYKRGEALLQAGDLRAALAAFEAGYVAAPRPGFLLNIANCHRKLGELGKARQHYRRFLDEAPRAHPARAEAVEYLRAIEEIAADGVALEPEPPARQPPPAAAPAARPAPPPVAAARPASPVAVAAPPAPAPVVPASAAAVDLRAGPRAPAAPPRATPSRAPWIWAAVGVVAASAVLGIVWARGRGDGCGAALGCLSE